MVKLLVTSDLHGDFAQAELLARKAKKENVDLVLLCGDLSFFGRGFEGLIGAFKKANKKVIMIPGNHDTIATTDFLAQLYSPGTYNIHGYSLKIGDIGFVGVGSEHGMDATSKKTRDLVEKSFQKLKGVKKKVLITHVVPADERYEDLGMVLDNESVELRKIVDKFKPDAVFCGHMHEFEGMSFKIGKTTIYNVGRNGDIIEL